MLKFFLKKAFTSYAPPIITSVFSLYTFIVKITGKSYLYSPSPIPLFPFSNQAFTPICWHYSCGHPCYSHCQIQLLLPSSQPGQEQSLVWRWPPPHTLYQLLGHYFPNFSYLPAGSLAGVSLSPWTLNTKCAGLNPQMPISCQSHSFKYISPLHWWPSPELQAYLSNLLIKYFCWDVQQTRETYSKSNSRYFLKNFCSSPSSLSQ